MWHFGNSYSIALADGAEAPGDFVVALVGYLAIFAVLTVIYLVCLAVGKASSRPVKAKAAIVKTESEAPAVKPLSEFADRRAAVAAISAAIAEELGEDVSRIRITSIKKIG